MSTPAASSQREPSGSSGRLPAQTPSQTGGAKEPQTEGETPKLPGLDPNGIRIFGGNSVPKMTEGIAAVLGIKRAAADVSRFPDGEIKVRILDDVRGRDCFVVQSTCPPVNDHLLEMLIIIDALKRASADRITAVMPYFGYGRQDRKHAGRVPITAKLIANLITASGVDRLVTIDMHAAQMQGFFDIPVDHLFARPVFLKHIHKLHWQDPVILCTDSGGLKVSHHLAAELNAELALIDKVRKSDVEVARGHVVGDIRDRDVIIIDDMIATGGSLVQAVNTAREYGARRILVLATHPVFCGRALEHLSGLEIEEMVVTDTIPVKKRPENLKLTILSMDVLLAQAIRRTHKNESISTLFEPGGY
ncbi:MAG TPA: ribose-phosphate pyrophosphokinase [Planctomycetota bacterium]|nr:ribose-phosphate pyrophosphokinase [Planctomycetota bacterium]